MNVYTENILCYHPIVMPLTAIKLKKFTAFENLEVKFSSGVNIFIGENGTGKTHLMKVAYAACNAGKRKEGFEEKLQHLFLPSGGIGRLVKRQQGRTDCSVMVAGNGGRFQMSFSNQHVAEEVSLNSKWIKRWIKRSPQSVYIPVKEMLSNAPGFLSLYRERELHFEAVYPDIIHSAFLPPPRGKKDAKTRTLLSILEKDIYGKVVSKGEEFFLKNQQGNLEFTLLAEGMRKLGLLHRLIGNGALAEGAVLFWDEPEANLNPKMYRNVVSILLELRRFGVQVFLATHDYCILKEFDLQATAEDKVAFHSLYRDSDDEICCHTTKSYSQIHPNAIADTFAGLYDRQVERTVKGVK